LGMPVNDAEPRYQFADPNGDVIGSIYFDEATDEARLAFDDGTEVVLGKPTQVGSSGTPGVFNSVSTEEILNVADTIVSSTSELESAFNNLSAGETIYIGCPDTPYRTSQWLDIDVDNVSVLAQSRFAENGDAIIKPADGADVGGIRIGANSACSGVSVEGVGFDGNQSTMTDTVKRLHGFIVDNATDVRIQDSYATQTHPYHEHNSGGSGVSVRNQASDVTIKRVETDDIGDRSIQIAGTDVSVETVRGVNGYDRVVALNVTEPDGLVYGASAVTVTNIFGRDLSEGSIVGTNGAENGITGGYLISNVQGRGQYRRAVQLSVATGNDIVRNVVVSGIDADGGSNEGINVSNGVERIMLSDVNVRNHDGWGVRFEVTEGAFSNVNIDNCNGGGMTLDGSAVVGSNLFITDVGGDGLYNPSCGASVFNGVNIRRAGDNGLVAGDTGVPQHYSGVFIEGANQNGSGSLDLDFAGTENTFQGRVKGSAGFNIAGTRCVVNGRSRQSAAPGSGNAGDDWNGNETLALMLGVTVEDTSTSPHQLYKADGAGNWVQIG